MYVMKTRPRRHDDHDNFVGKATKMEGRANLLIC